MNSDATHLAVSLSKTPSRPSRLGIHHLPTEILFLIFWCLHGQDIARCMRVCRCFADLIDSDVHLQYRIELAQNGMVDGLSSVLPVSERRQRLRQYSAHFRNGVFDFEDPTAHPEYVHQLHNLQWDGSSRTEGVTSIHYINTNSYDSVLSVFTDGSSQAGISSRRWIMPIGTAGDQTRSMNWWVIDRAQDLLVTIECVNMPTNPQFFEVRFCSWTGSQATRTDHPAATLPCIEVFPPSGYGGDPAHYFRIYSFIVEGSYVVWKLEAVIDQVDNYSAHVCNWRTGQMISQIDLGSEQVTIAVLDDAYILALLRNFDSHVEPHLTVYDLSPSIPNHPLCALQLPTLTLNSGDRIMDRDISTSKHSPVPEGHFRADPSMSMVVLTHEIEKPQYQEHTSYLLIPYAALLTKIRAVVESSDPYSHDPPVLVPWTDWGAHACLRLRVPPQLRGSDRIGLVPYGSQMPVLGFHDPDHTRASVYVFDVNPLAARHALHTARAAQSPAPGESGGLGPTATATAVVTDVEAALPGIVDWETAAIPFVVYRFQLPRPPSEGPAQRAIPSRITAVRMSMTGFTATFERFGPHMEHHTWTV